MARKKGVTGTLIQVQRELERQQRQREKAARDAERVRKAAIREQARQHAEARLEEAEERQDELEDRIEKLTTILEVGLQGDAAVDVNDLKEQWSPEPFDPGRLRVHRPRPQVNQYGPPPLRGLARRFPGAQAKHERLVAEEQARFLADKARWQAAEDQRLAELDHLRSEHQAQVDAEKERVARQHAKVDEFIAALVAREPDAVEELFSLALSRSEWPVDFPEDFDLAYDSSSSLLGVDFALPDLSIVPDVKTYRYVKARDEIASTAMPVTRRRDIYRDLVSQSALRVLHEIFVADRFGLADTVVVNCYVESINPATGKMMKACIVSVRTTNEIFADINLDHVDASACLKGLAAAVSPKPEEMEPVRPVIELKMIDPRFTTEQDVLSDLDQRPNLLDLTPTEFESLITNLFMAMGLESRQTQASRDGGVDCVAYDPRPIFGGKVVIQAKRYAKTVGVAAVRDLYGTMQNEGASKGILVTTSGYGKASYKFAEGKPIELLSGPNLLYLLEEHTNIRARIVSPDGSNLSTFNLVDPDEPGTPVGEAPPEPSTPGSHPQHNPFPQPRSGRS